MQTYSALNLTVKNRKRYAASIAITRRQVNQLVKLNLESSPRIACFSDTYGFQTNNGVGRFLENLRQYSLDSKLPVQFYVPGKESDDDDLRFVRAPSFSVPGYPDLRIYIPLEHQRKQLAHEIKKWKPGVLHVSTPGPMGFLGVSLSREMKLPLVGIYHTDFPEYARSIVESQLLSFSGQAQEPFKHPFVQAVWPWLQQYAMPQVMKLMMGNPGIMDDVSALKSIGGRNIKLLLGDADWREKVGAVAGKCTTLALKNFYSRFSVVVARSESQVEQIEKTLEIPRDRIQCLTPGIDVQRFNPQNRQIEVWNEFGVAQESFKVLYVGRITSEKNFSFLIDAWTQLQSMATPIKQVELIVVGRGEQKLIQQIESLPNVHVLGARRGDMLSKIYASSDLLVFPSVTETLGQVGLEAAASGLPVIASDQGGPRMYIEHGKSGYVLPVDDAQPWAQKIIELVNNQDLHRQIAASARDKIASEFSFRASLESYAKIHQSAIDAHSERKRKRKQRLDTLKRPQLTSPQLSRRGVLVITDYHAGKRYGNAKNRLQKLAAIESMFRMAQESNLDVIFGGDFGDHGARPERSEADFRMLREVRNKVGFNDRPVLIRGNHDFGFTDEQLAKLADCDVSNSLIYRHPESRVVVTHGHILGLQRVIDMLDEHSSYQRLENELTEEKLDADLKPSVIAYDLANLAESLMQKRGLSGLGAFWEGLYETRSMVAENILKLGQGAQRMDDRTWKMIASLVGSRDDLKTAAMLGNACKSWATVFGHTHEPLGKTIKTSGSTQLVANAGCINRKSPTCVVARFPEVRIMRFNHETSQLQVRNHIWLPWDDATEYESKYFNGSNQGVPDELMTVVSESSNQVENL